MSSDEKMERFTFAVGHLLSAYEDSGYDKTYYKTSCWVDKFFYNMIKLFYKFFYNMITVRTYLRSTQNDKTS